MNTVYPLKTLNQLRPLLIGFRKANGLTQKEVSERLGVTQQTYARLEANPGSVSIERLFRVLTVLGVEVVLSSEPRGLFSTSSSTTEGAEKPIDSPTQREKW
jgi:HTH-type transcriptional regulator / antitoxin HipB